MSASILATSSQEQRMFIFYRSLTKHDVAETKHDVAETKHDVADLHRNFGNTG
jgi:hypothetical protein